MVNPRDILPQNLIFSLIGWLYLWIKYRNKEKVLASKNADYLNSYSFAGHRFILDAFLIIFIMLIVGCLAAGIFAIIRGLF